MELDDPELKILIQKLVNKLEKRKEGFLLKKRLSNNYPERE